MNKAQVMFSRGNPDQQGKNLYFYSCTNFFIGITETKLPRELPKIFGTSIYFPFQTILSESETSTYHRTYPQHAPDSNKLF